MMKRIKVLLRAILPGWFLRIYVKVWVKRRRKYNARKSITEIFTGIYSANEWGGAPGEFYSGPGSEDPSVSLYAGIIKAFINSHQITAVVDLGCGDFKVGRQMQVPGVRYFGVDIVQALVDRNQGQFGSDSISFRCLDIIKDRLPDAELCLIRQVLQHLSNEEIKLILDNVKKYRYVIITEQRLPAYMKIVPNKEKPHGPDTRSIDNSCVYLDRPPFNVKISEVLLDMEAQNYEYFKGERLVTLLIKQEPLK
jgi:SAM-dependent methyltransferase